MAIERKWLTIPPRLFTADGTDQGVITVSTTKDVRVKMLAVIQAPNLPPIQTQVKRVISETQFVVGPTPQELQGKAGLRTTTDISAYTVAEGSFFYCAEQDKSMLKPDDIEQATYEQEPVVARRVISVDQFGNFYDNDNPLPISDVGSAADKAWDDLLLTRDPVTQDLVKAEYKKDGNVVRTLDFTYDEFENLIEVKKS